MINPQFADEPARFCVEVHVGDFVQADPSIAVGSRNVGAFVGAQFPPKNVSLQEDRPNVGDCNRQQTLAYSGYTDGRNIECRHTDI